MKKRKKKLRFEKNDFVCCQRVIATTINKNNDDVVVVVLVVVMAVIVPVLISVLPLVPDRLCQQVANVQRCSFKDAPYLTPCYFTPHPAPTPLVTNNFD